MSNLLFCINAVFPIILTVALGYFLKRIGLIPISIVPSLNKLVFRIFLPIMLFLNVYGIESFSGMDMTFMLYITVFTFAIFFITLPLVLLITKDPSRRGPLHQGTFRSNYAFVGLPLSAALCGEEGVIAATVLSAVLVPLFNALAVVSLSIFKKDSKTPLIGRIFRDVIKNPLIQSIALGGVVLLIRYAFTRLDISFRLSDVTFVYKTLTSLSNLATPLALIALGAQFEFSKTASMKKEIFFIVAIKGIIAPFLSLGIAYLLGCFAPAHFACFIASFATPISISSVPMTQEMGSDSTLAGQLVIWTTVVSAFSIFLCTLVLRLLGIF